MCPHSDLLRSLLKPRTPHPLHTTQPPQIPIYDFKLSKRVGTTDQEVPPSRVIIIEGIYALSEPLQILDVAAAHADVPIVMTSGGQLNISGLDLVDAWLALGSAPNLHVMTNGVYRQDFIERLARDFDPSRVLYASFSPYFDLTYERRRVESARLEPESRRLIEGANACRLFSFASTSQ